MILVAMLSNPDSLVRLPALPVTNELRVIADLSLKGDYAAKLCASAPDVVVMDLRAIPEFSAKVVANVRKCVPKAGILVVGVPNAMPPATAALTAGAHGYLTRDISCGSLLLAIHSLVNGRLHLSQTGRSAVACLLESSRGR